MTSFFRFVVVAFFFAGILILSVYLRGADRRAFHTLGTYRAEQNLLRQELWQKQLRVEFLTNPASVSQRVGY